MTLNWTHEPSRGKHGIYLIHHGIHYNALRLRDNQEDGEQKEESNIRKDTNKTQQRRTKEHATPTQDIQNNLLEKNTHEEGDEMRATNAPCGSRTQDKTNGKGNENHRNTKPCVRQSIEKQKRKDRLKSTTNKRVNATGGPTPCGQTPETSEKHRRTKVKQQPALGQATKTPLQPVELECDHGHISC
jgi:hypothetical protein